MRARLLCGVLLLWCTALYLYLIFFRGVSVVMWSQWEAASTGWQQDSTGKGEEGLEVCIEGGG